MGGTADRLAYDAVEAMYVARAAALRAARPALALRARRYRGAPVVRFEPMPEAAPRPLEGYTDRPWYRPSEAAAFHLRSPHARSTLVVARVAGPGRFEEAARVPFDGRAHDVPPDAAARGCRWPPTLALPLAGFRPGYYRATIHAEGASGAEEAGSAITFLVGAERPRHRVAVLAPVGTWAAYNPYGGQSLYHNERDRSDVHVVATGRPNPALGWDARTYIHAAPVEAHAYTWLDDEVGADLYPDHALETPGVLAPYRVLVLAYHAEYATEAMARGLRRLVRHGRSLLSLGANQLYWRVRWHEGPARLEARKDGAPLSDGRPGGRFRRSAWPEDRLQGVRFTDAGTGTYAPYRVADARHWLYDGLGVRDGQVFGEAGTTPYPICGDETDTPSPLSRLRAEVLARGLNRAEAVDGPYTLWRPGDPAWDGSGGGTLALTPLSRFHAVLATGAIHSASGLGVDPVFTGVARNFLRRYLGPS